ncbi:Hint domain-containing protein [Gymnodinialimonas sp.]
MATINGDNNGNNLDGTDNDDTINGEGGNDQLDGKKGNDSIDGGSGNDTLKGDEGNDSMDGGLGDDQLEGGKGDDTLIDDHGNSTMQGGEGNDEMYANGDASSLDGGEGDDYIAASSGDDTIEGDKGADTIFANEGNDSVRAGEDNDEVYGGGGNDTIDAGEGNDTVSGGDGDDTIFGDKGADVIYGGEGNDTIDGGEDNDALSGGAGNDSITAGKGNDTIEGGEGDDTMRAGEGTDTFVIRDGHGSDRILNFSSNDIIAFDMAEITSYQDVLDRMSGDDTTVITFDNGDTLRLVDFEREDIGPSNFAYSAGPVCVLEGTPIRTERGDVAIEDLRPDDIIWTKDNGWQAIRLLVRETIHFSHRDDPGKPILIPAGALGDNLPAEPLITSPQHRVLQSIPHTEEEVLVPAVKLIGSNGIRRMRGRKSASYYNVVMERHSIIQAAGCWVESMLVTTQSLSRQHAAARRLLDHCLGMEPARRIERKGTRPRRLKLA